METSSLSLSLLRRRRQSHLGWLYLELMVNRAHGSTLSLSLHDKKDFIILNRSMTVHLSTTHMSLEWVFPEESKDVYQPDADLGRLQRQPRLSRSVSLKMTADLIQPGKSIVSSHYSDVSSSNEVTDFSFRRLSTDSEADGIDVFVQEKHQYSCSESTCFHIGGDCRAVSLFIKTLTSNDR